MINRQNQQFSYFIFPLTGIDQAKRLKLNALSQPEPKIPSSATRGARRILKWPENEEETEDLNQISQQEEPKE